VRLVPHKQSLAQSPERYKPLQEQPERHKRQAAWEQHTLLRAQQKRREDEEQHKPVEQVDEQPPQHHAQQQKLLPGQPRVSILRWKSPPITIFFSLNHPHRLI
jgi:hypothetical protein